MQDGTGHQPVPAPESVVENLPREILEKDCMSQPPLHLQIT